MKVEFHEDAVTDFQEAVRHYAEISWRLVAQFEAEFQEFIEKVSENPSHYHFAQRRIYRRANLRRFPYRILYRVDEQDQTVRIMVICHNKRHPSYGMNRN
jgi:plasmid stabilization system protein ParE